MAQVKPVKMKDGELEEQLRVFLLDYGETVFWDTVRSLQKGRINPKREYRVKWPGRLYQYLFDAQQGMCKCGRCGERLLMPAKRNHVDHIDPHAARFNDRENLCLVLPKHNLRKSANSIPEESKASGKSFVSILKRSEP